MSMIITAKDNDKIKSTKSLLKSKNRNKDELKQETVYKHELYTVSCVSIR